MKPLGYDIDTAKLMAHSLGVKLELVPVTSANRVPYLQTDKVDLVISSLGNERRAREGHRLLGRLRAVLQWSVWPGGPEGVVSAGRSGGQDHWRDAPARWKTLS